MAKISPGGFLINTEEFEVPASMHDEFRELLGVELDNDDLQIVELALACARGEYKARKQAADGEGVARQLEKISSNCRWLASALVYDAALTDTSDDPSQSAIDGREAAGALRWGLTDESLSGEKQMRFIDETRRAINIVGECARQQVDEYRSRKGKGRGPDVKHLRTLLIMIQPVLTKYGLPTGFTRHSATSASKRTSLWAEFGNLVAGMLDPEEQPSSSSALLRQVEAICSDNEEAWYLRSFDD